MRRWGSHCALLGPLLRGSLLAGTRAAGASAAPSLMKGIGYSPVPLKGHGSITLDDFMAEAAKPLWSPHGRGDLAIMRSLGATEVRLYGNDPQQDHREFLDTAHATGLGVVAGQSDWPFTQMTGNCLQSSNFDCYSQVKESYLGNLRGGFLVDDRTYHPGLSSLVVVNEPDLKLPGIKEPRSFCKAVISAIDAIVSAEGEMNVTGRLINLTVAFSFGICTECKQPSSGQKPGLGQMLELRNAFLHPEQYGYQPRNDLTEVYSTRFTNCFNTANPATDMRPLFFDQYQQNFPSVPVFIGEYHAAQFSVSQLEDFQEMLRIADGDPLLVGVFFFEFQVRYDKGGAEMNFGMFGLGDYAVTHLTFGSGSYTAWCLTPVEDSSSGMAMPAVVAEVFGGDGVDLDQLCVPDPSKVPLTETGFADVLAQHSTERTAVFVGRVVQHSGGEVTDAAGLQLFARGTTSFQGLLDAIEQHPTWATWDPFAACVADRDSDTGTVGLAIERACKDSWFNCANIPAECKESTWLTADYVFSVYHNQVVLQDGAGGPVTTCNFNGAAIFARSALYSTEDHSCVVSKNPQTTPLTDEGFQAIITQNESSRTAIFVRRVITQRLLAQVANEDRLQSFSKEPPASMTDLTRLLSGALWVCAGDTGRACPKVVVRPTPAPRNGLAWRKWAFAGLGGLVLCTVLGTCIYVSMPRRSRKPKSRQSLRPTDMAVSASSSSSSSESEVASEGA